jgi:hypothetical protein
MPGYGIDTVTSDPFGVITDLVAGDATAVLKTQNFSSVPHAKTGAYAIDEFGDSVAATYYGDQGSAGTLASDISYELVLSAGSFDMADLVLGGKGSGLVMTSVEVTTKNNEWPKISVSGRDAVSTADLTGMGTWALPTLTINGRKKAQPIGFTVGVGCKLQGCGVTAKVDDANEAGDLGEEAAYDVDNGILTGTADLMEVTAACTWTIDVPFGATETQVPGEDKSNTAYGNATGAFELVLTRVTP